MKISETFKLKAASEVHSIIDELSGIIAVVIASSDGFDIASASNRKFEPARVAAMASSISAIGAVVSKEAKLGVFKSITIDTDKGFAYISPARHGRLELVINIIADSSAVLAQVIYRCKACIKTLEEP